MCELQAAEERGGFEKGSAQAGGNAGAVYNLHKFLLSVELPPKVTALIRYMRT